MGALDNQMSKPMVRRSREAVAGVHRAHCCWIHGCKYGADDCPVTDPATMLAQDTPCEECDDAIRNNWSSIKGMNDAYDAGRRAGQAEGQRHGFTEGAFRGFVQGREYQRSGRLVPMDLGPLYLGAEVTDAMVEAFGAAWDREDQMVKAMGETLHVAGSRRRAGLRAVLAILRRDLGEER